MSRRLIAHATLAVLVLAAPIVVAQNKETRKDPAGVKGISPFWEHVKSGDNAYVARDFDGAIAAYQEALKAEPQNALGHYRKGEAHLAKGDMKEAEASWVAALRFVGDDRDLKAKALFVLADLRERQRSLDDAKDSWSKYEQHSQQNPQTKTFPATPVDRKKRADEWATLVDQYAEVKKRIEARLAEVDRKK